MLHIKHLALLSYFMSAVGQGCELNGSFKDVVFKELGKERAENKSRTHFLNVDLTVWIAEL